MRKSTLKTISWLIVSFILIAGCTWYESGELWVGLLAAGWACLIKTPIYWLHEHMWEYRRWFGAGTPLRITTETAFVAGDREVVDFLSGK